MYKYAIALLALVTFALPARADHYKIDTVHSFVEFRAGHIGIGFVFGRFNDVQGAFDFDTAGVGLTAFDGKVAVASVDTKVKARDEDLKSANYFDAAKFPTIEFHPTAFVKSADGGYQVAGDLTLHGVRKSIEVKLTKRNEGKDPWGGYRLGLYGTLVVKRSEYGMKKDLLLVDDDVALTFSFEGVRQ